MAECITAYGVGYVFSEVRVASFPFRVMGLISLKQRTTKGSRLSHSSRVRGLMAASNLLYASSIPSIADCDQSS